RDRVVPQDAQLQAAAAEVDDACGLRLRPHGCKYRFPAEPRLFLSADDFQANTGRLLDPVNQGAAVLRFPGSAGGNGAILGYAIFLNDFVEMAKRLNAFLQNLLAE